METRFQRFSVMAFVAASLGLTACINSIKQDIPQKAKFY